jgi:hypothetical protein
MRAARVARNATKRSRCTGGMEVIAVFPVRNAMAREAITWKTARGK